MLTITLVGLSFQIRMSVRANLMHSIDGELTGMARFASRTMRRGWGFAPGGYPGGAFQRTPGGSRNGFNNSVRELDTSIGVQSSTLPDSQALNSSQRQGVTQPNSLPGNGSLRNSGRNWELPNVPATRVFVNGPRTILNEPPWDIAAYDKTVTDGADVNSVINNPTGKNFRILTRLVRLPGGSQSVVQCSFPLAEMERATHSLDLTLLAIIPLVLVLAGGGGAFLTAKALSPVRQITRAAENISAQDLSMRLPVAADDEFADLSRTFNAMLSRLEGSFQQQRRFTSDASHELKSPLTVIKANTGLALRTDREPEEYVKRLQAIDKAANHMRILVDDLLILARSDEAKLAAETEHISVAELLIEATELVKQPGTAPIFLPEADEAIELADTFVIGTRYELMRVFKNLLENAVRHTEPGGKVCIHAECSEGTVQVSVVDTGEGISAEHLMHLGERFYRVDSSRVRTRGGSGLGLAICKSIVEAHRGNIQFESQPGIGTKVTVSLPLLPQQA